MTTFRHLTRKDLDQLTRAELAHRVLQESEYWKRIPANKMDEKTVLAYLEFLHVTAAVHNPRGLTSHLSSLIDGHDDGYLDEKPGRSSPEEQ
jgi:lysozyme family protein